MSMCDSGDAVLIISFHGSCSGHDPDNDSGSELLEIVWFNMGCDGTESVDARLQYARPNLKDLDSIVTGRAKRYRTRIKLFMQIGTVHVLLASIYSHRCVLRLDVASLEGRSDHQTIMAQESSMKHLQPPKTLSKSSTEVLL